MADAGELKARATLENQQFLKAVADMTRATQESAETSSARFAAIGDAIGGVTTALASLGALAGLASFASSALEAANNTEKLHSAFVALNGPTQETEAVFAHLADLEMKSMFDFEDTIGPAAKQMMLLGVSAEDTEKQMIALVDAAAGLKEGPEWITNVSAALATMQSHTVATAKDMKTLEKQFGPEVWQPIADMLGTDVPGAMEQIQKGLVSTRDVANAVTEDLGERFEGAAERSMAGWKGAMHVLDESTEEAMVAIGGAIKGVLDAIAPIVRAAADGVKALADWFSGLSAPVKEAIVIVTAVTATFITIAGAVAGLTTALGGLGAAAAGLALNPMTLAITAAVAALALLGKWVFDNWPAVKAALAAAGEFLQTLFSPLITLWKAELNLLWGAVQAVFTPLVEYWQWAWGLITGVAAKAIEIVKGAFDYVVNLISSVPGGDKLVAQFKAIGTAWDDAQKQMAAAAKADEEKKKSAEAVAAATHQQRVATQKATEQAVLATAASKAEADALKTKKEKTEQAKKAVDDLTAAYKTLGITSESSLRAELTKAQQALFAVTLAFENGRASVEDLRLAQVAVFNAQEKLDNHLKGNLTPDLNAASQAAAAFAGSLDVVTKVSLVALDAALTTTTQNLAIQKSATEQLAGAYHELGIKSKAEWDIMVADAYGAWAQIESDQNASQQARLTAQAEYLRQVKAAADAGYGTWTKDQDAALKTIEKQLETSSGTQKTIWTDFGKEVSTIVTNFAQDMAKALFDGDMSWGEKAKTMLKDLGEAAVSVFITPFANALKEFISGALADLLSGKGLGGVLDRIEGIGSAIGKVFGGGGGGGVIPEIPSGIPGIGSAPGIPQFPGPPPGTGGAGGAMGGLGGAMGAVGAIGGVASAISGIVGNFQMMGMNKTLDLIENYTRYTKIYTGEQSDSILKTGHEIRNILRNFEGNYWGVTVPAMGEIVTAAAGIDEKLNLYIGPDIYAIRDNTGQLVTASASIVSLLTSIQGAGPRAINVTVTATGVTTEEAARVMGNQIAQNLTTQLMPR